MKLFSFNKNQAAVLVTIMVLVVLGALYFLVYVPGNERRIQKQRFQALQNIDASIHIKIENSIALLNNTLSDYVNGDQDKKNRLSEYIQKFQRDFFTLGMPEKIVYDASLSAKDSSAADSAYYLNANNDNQYMRLTYVKNFVLNNDSLVTYRMEMEFSYKQFFASLLRGNVFDQYIVFKDQKPVYETFPAGISNFQKDTVLGLKNGIAGASIGAYEVGGIDYRFFLQPVRLNSDNDWVVAGLLSNEHYQSKKNQLPPQVVLLLVTIVLLLLVSFPWVKLYQMGSKDRLTLRDAVASLLISMLLMSLFFFLFFHHNESFRSRSPINSKKVIADSIHYKFIAETREAIKKLNQFDSLLSIAHFDSISKYDPEKLAKENNFGIRPQDTPVVRAVDIGRKVVQVFWINEAGREIINWRLRWGAPKYHPYGVYRERNYFREIRANGGYRFDAETPQFFLEQVISWTRFTFTSVIAKRSRISEERSTVVSCMSFNMNSVEDVLLPAGYEFAVIDNGGKVLYHSDKLRNLNETLTEKISDSNELKSLLAARAPGSFKTTYYDNHYEVEVLPVVGLPYFIVVLEDTAYEDTRVTENYGFTFSMLILFFAFLVLMLFGIFILSAKRSFFKKQAFDTSWIGPRLSCHKEYLLSIIMNVVIIFVMITTFSEPGFLTYLFILFFTVSFVPLFQNCILAKRYFDEKKSMALFKRNAIIGLTIIIFFIDVVALRILDNGNVAWLFLYELFLIFAGLAVYLLRESIFTSLRKMTTARFGQLVSFRWNYVNSFALMALTRLVITSGIPIVFFYVNSYNYEQNLGARFRQSDFADKVLKKYKEMRSRSGQEFTGRLPGVYFDNQSIKDYRKVAWPEKPADTNSIEDTKALQLLRQFRLNLKEQAVKQHRYYQDLSGDSSLRFNHILRENCQKANTSVLYRKDPRSDSAFVFRSGPVNYSFPDFGINKRNGFLFWSLLLLGLVVFYFLIYKITRKIFALKLPDIDTWKQIDHSILSNRLLNGTLFVIGLPGSGKKYYLKDKIKKREITFDDGEPIVMDDADEAQNNGFIAELVNIPTSGNEPEEKALWKKYTKTVFDPKHKLIIVNHFEYNIHDPVSNHYKLQFLEHLYLETRCKIIILSTIHPVAFLDSMEHFNKEENKIVPGQELERWHVLLGHYRIVVLPLQLGISNEIPAANLHRFLKRTLVDERDNKPVQNALVTIKDTDVKTTTNEAGAFYLQKESLPFTVCIAAKGFRSTEVQLDEHSNEVIGLEEDDSFIFTELTLKETSNTHFLRNMQQSVFEAAANVPQDIRIEKFDDLAFKLQITSHYFYMYIWQSLTKEEKFLLYDLAEDNLVNSFDDYNLSMLLAKGVIIRRDGALKFFNKGFRNFILSAIGHLEAAKIKSQIGENGNWSKLKGPLQIVIIAILFFLFASQEEAFSKIIGYVAALGAGIPAVLKLFSMFDRTSGKTS